MREFLKGLELDKETIDSIMSEYGKTVQTIKEEKEELATKVQTYESEIAKLKESSEDADSWKSKFEELDNKLKAQEEEAKAKAEDDALTNRITTAFGDKQFINELTKSALIQQMKTAIKDDTNVGKSDVDIFNSLVKDQENIFVNPNKPADIPPMGGDGADDTVKSMPDLW